MSAMAIVSTLVWLAQSPPLAPSDQAHNVTLEFQGYWGAYADHSTGTDSCPGVEPGSDVLTGIVRGVEDELDEDGITYTGVLTRTTAIGLCEAKDTPDGTRFCGGRLSGGGSFKVTIRMPALGHDNEEATIELEPVGVMAVWVTVSGSCDSLDNAEVEDDYRSADAIHFETTGSSSALPPGKLVPGLFTQARQFRLNDQGQYTLRVN
jgi:hypothetical protein